MTKTYVFYDMQSDELRIIEILPIKWWANIGEIYDGFLFLGKL